MAGMFAARPDSTCILFPGRRGIAVFYRQPQTQRANLRTDVWSCGAASVAFNFSGNFSSLPALNPNLLHVRGHVDPDRVGLRLPVPAGVRAGANASGYAGYDPDLF